MLPPQGATFPQLDAASLLPPPLLELLQAAMLAMVSTHVPVAIHFAKVVMVTQDPTIPGAREVRGGGTPLPTSLAARLAARARQPCVISSQTAAALPEKARSSIFTAQ
jgi:hypothetical protein